MRNGRGRAGRRDRELLALEHDRTAGEAPTGPRFADISVAGRRAWIRSSSLSRAIAISIPLAAWTSAPAQGATIYSDGALCSLTDAIVAANGDIAVGGCDAGSGADLIFVGYDVVLVTADMVRSTFVDGAFAGLPDVASDVTIVGFGAGDRIERNLGLGCDADSTDDFRLFNVLPDARLRLVGLTLSGGCVAGGSPGRGGAIHVGGSGGTTRARLQLGTVTLTRNSVFGADGAEGGAIAGEFADVMVANGVMSQNRAVGADVPGFGSARGGAMALEDSVLTQLTGTVLSENRAEAGATSGSPAEGGAIRLSAGTGTCTASVIDGLTIYGNSATGGSGAVDGGSAAGGAVFLLDCQVDTMSRLDATNNAALGGAAGTGTGGRAVGGALALSDSTIAILSNSVFGTPFFGGNFASGGSSASGAGGVALGGGIGAIGTESSFVSLVATTFVSNRAQGGNGALGSGGGGQDPAARGGGLYIGADQSDTRLLENLTFYANWTAGGLASGAGQSGGSSAGGGLWVSLGRSVDRPTPQVRHLTVMDNSVYGPTRSGSGAAGMTIAGLNGIAPELDNNLFARNYDYTGGAADLKWDVKSGAGPVSQGYNYFESEFGGALFTAATDVGGIVTGVYSGSGANGCTVPLASGSCIPTLGLTPISNVADRGSCTTSTTTVDARGFVRPQDVLAAPDADDGCDPGAFELTPGRIVIVADVVPDLPLDVQFGGDLGAFSLDDDTDPTLPRERLFEVIPGSFWVYVSNSQDFQIAINCVDPTGDSYGYFNEAGINVAAGETVTCTFRLQKRTLVRFVQDSVPDNPLFFSYRGDLQFSLADEYPSSYWRSTQVDVTPGTYHVNQLVQDNAPLTGLSCVDPTGGTTTDLPGASVTLGVDPADTVTCTFTNTLAHGFFTVTPCRVLDTRQYTGGELSDGEQVEVDRWDLEACGIPPTATAIAYNLTAVSPTANGYLNVYPYPLSEPGTSTLSFRSGVNRGNNGVTMMTPAIYYYGYLYTRAHLVGGGQVHVVLDVFGYFQ